MRRKDFWLLSAVTKLLNEFIPKLSHDADGLIFQVGNEYRSFSFLLNIDDIISSDLSNLLLVQCRAG